MQLSFAASRMHNDVCRRSIRAFRGLSVATGSATPYKSGKTSGDAFSCSIAAVTSISEDLPAPQSRAGSSRTAARIGSLWRAHSTLARRTSLMAQFQRVKTQFPEHLLLFQVGDFYELYGEDAGEAASKTSLRLTKKAGVLMAGFPVRSLDEWQRVLVEAGLQLAICNQQPAKKDSANAGLLEREVVRLVTPGTLSEPLDQQANYLLCLAPGPSPMLGLAWADVSTAEFKVSSVGVASLDEDLERLCPSEVLLPTAVRELVLDNRRIGRPDYRTEELLQSSRLKECHLTAVPEEWYREDGETTDWEHRFCSVFRDGNFSALERSAACALLHYISHTHRHLLPHLLSPSHFTHSQHMAIDANTRRALELISPLHNNPKKATLLGCVDKTVTAGGARLLRARLAAPLTDVDTINRRLDSVELFCSLPLHCEAIRQHLRPCTDLERALQKVGTKTCSAADLRAMNTTLCSAACVLSYVSENLPDAAASVLEEEVRGLREMPDLVQELDAALGGPQCSHLHYISTGYAEEVDRLREEMRGNEVATQALASCLQLKTGVHKLTVMNYKAYGRVFEASKTQAVKLEQCPDLMRIDRTQAKTRFTHVELQRFNAELQGLEARYVQLQEDLFQLLCDMVMLRADDIMETAASLARLDVATSLGLLAADRGYARPTVLSEPVFKVEQGLHPVLSSLEGSHGFPSLSSQFVSNDCSMDTNRLWVVTGPNMGGKSTFLRQNALLLILAQMGSFVPAREATLGVADRLFARVGASDNVARHKSTFHVEMSETASILCTATRHSFVVLDEIGRGTSATEGIALAEAVIEYLSIKIGCRALVATHYQQLADLTERLSGVGSYKLVAERDSEGIIFTYRVESGKAEHSFGIEVAHLAGIPMEVIQRAKELLRRHK